VLAEVRNVVGHGQLLDATTVEPWAAEYLADEHLDVTVRDLVRDVIERLAVSGDCGPERDSSAPASR
jgi:hypothetical protein